MAKFVKKRGVDFKHIEWEISEVHSVKVRRNIPRETLCALDRVLICKSHVTTVSYCCACVDYANIVLNVAKTKKCQYKTKFIVKQHHQNSRLIQNAKQSFQNIQIGEVTK